MGIDATEMYTFMPLPAKIQADVLAFFDRCGAAPQGEVHYDEKDKPYWMAPRNCGRCGGAGASDRWERTGRTCYDCGGSGRHKNGPSKVRLYTAAENEKLDAATGKRRAKRQAEFETQQAALAKAAADNHEAFQAQHGDLLRRADAYLMARYGWDVEAEDLTSEGVHSFVNEIITRARRTSVITQGQVDAIEKELARYADEQARKQASRYQGQEGERLTRTITAKIVIRKLRGKFNAPWIKETVFWAILHDEQGNTYVCESTSFTPRRNAVMKIMATVKGYTSYNGEQQTKLNRVKVLEVLQPGTPFSDDEA